MAQKQADIGGNTHGDDLCWSFGWTPRCLPRLVALPSCLINLRCFRIYKYYYVNLE